MSSSKIASKASGVFNRLKVGPMKRLYKYYTPNAINLAGGVPMDSIFPFHEVQVKLHADNSTLTLTHKDGTLSNNYMRGDGIPSLKSWIQNHVKQLHSPPTDIGTCMTIGSTDALVKIFTLLNGDAVLLDEYAYGTVSQCKTFGRSAYGVAMDKYGMLPGELEKQIIHARAEGKNPDCVYLVPTAQNPTGRSMDEARKREIYDVCSAQDIVIVEDDAYYYIYHGDCPIIPPDHTSLPGLKRLPKSFAALDVDGRVLRLDSLSKFIAPGMRLGWVTAPKDFIDKYLILQENTSQFPCGVSQSIFHGIVKHWGEDNLHKYAQKFHYLHQRDAMISSLQKEFRPHEVHYNIPDGGMFVWLTFPDTVKMSSEELFKVLAENEVIVVPGDDLSVFGTVSTSGPSIRLTYAAASPEQIKEGIRRLAVGIRKILSQNN